MVAASLWKNWRNKASIKPEQRQKRECDEALHGVAALSLRPSSTASAGDACCGQWTAGRRFMGALLRRGNRVGAFSAADHLSAILIC